MKEKGKIVLIILALIGFATVAVLLIMKIDDISKAHGAVNSSYKITYRGNGGYYIKSGGARTDKLTYSSNNKIKDNLFTKNGYSFVGWNTKADGSGVDVTDKIDTIYDSLKIKSLTLYAQWKKGKLVPDPEFEKCIMHSTNKELGSIYGITPVVTASRMAKLKTLNCSSVMTDSGSAITYSVSNASGIEIMKNLTSLSMSNSSVKKLDLSKNTKLQTIMLRNFDKISSINLTKNTNLTNLTMTSVVLKSLNLTKNTKLVNLSLDSLFDLESLNLTKNTNLQTLKLYALSKITTLNLTKNTNLKDVGLASLPIASLNLSKNTKLEKMGLYNLNNITTLSLKKNKKLNAISLDKLSNITTLTILSSVPRSNISILDCPKIKVNYVTYNDITINTTVEGNGYLGDNISGTSLACRNDFVQFNIKSKVGSTIKKVEYSTDGNTWKALSSKNVAYKNGAATVKITNSQGHIMFRITDKAGNVEVTKVYRICIEK